jgi:trans-2,3-dihydro-3-hydroxyanthranilate isomerase
MREIDYMVYDVFTNRALAGNPLGVVLDAEVLDAAQMQAIARELNLSETIFFQRSNLPGHAAKVRIFMPNGELPFAGHPTVGGAIAFAASRKLADGATVVLEEGVGPVSCIVIADSNGGHASFTVPRLSKQLDFVSSTETIANALGISADDIGLGKHALSLWSAGVPYVMVPVKSIEALKRLAFDPQKWLRLNVEREGKIAAPYVYAPRGSPSEMSFQARMFAPWDGIPEDPATGSAVAAFSGAAWKAASLMNGGHDIVIHQGIEMGRPAKIDLYIEGHEGRLSRATISGEAVKVAIGKLFLPDL